MHPQFIQTSAELSVQKRKVQSNPTILRQVSVEIPKHLATGLLSSGFFVIHDAQVSGENNVAEKTRGQKILNPMLDLVQLDVETGRDDSALVDASIELHNNLAGAAIINDFKLTNVT
jgi:hypothetical protein